MALLINPSFLVSFVHRLYPNGRSNLLLGCTGLLVRGLVQELAQVGRRTNTQTVKRFVKVPTKDGRMMEAINPQYRRNTPEVARAAAHSRPLVGSGASSRQVIQLSHNAATRGRDAAGEGFQKLKHRLTSRGIPESVIDELFEQPTIVSYSRGSFIFLQGAPTDLLYWVSSGLVDIICPGLDGEQIRASILGPGDFFGFVENADHKGRPVQAFQARARTNARIGLVIRAQVYKVLARQDPVLLTQILQEVITASVN
jgi:hypothetical protein